MKRKFFTEYTLLISAIIGVGFASGKEIEEFFSRFSIFSIVGIIILVIFFIYFSNILYDIKTKHKLNTFSGFNNLVFKNSKVIDFIQIFDYIITSSAMLAGLNSITNSYFKFSYIYELIIIVVTFFIIINGKTGLSIMSNILVPVMFLSIIINSIYNIDIQSIKLISTQKNLINSILYSLFFSANNYMLMFALILKNDSNKKEFKKQILSVSLTLGILITLIVIALGFQASNYAMPLLEKSKNLPQFLYLTYIVSLFIALFSTFVMSCYSANDLMPNKINKTLSAFIIIVISYLISMIGFSNSIKYLYTISGIISLVFCLYVIYFYYKDKRKTTIKNNHCNGYSTDIK